MKRIEPIRTIESFGCILVRDGGRQEWYRNPTTGLSQPVARHREINEYPARHVISMLANPRDDEPVEGDDKATPA